MGIFNLFSKRQEQLRAEPTDILVYDELPQALRVQIVHIIIDGFGEQIDLGYRNRRDVEDGYKALHDILCREYGLFVLNQHESSYRDSVANFILQEKNVERVLDAIELGIRFIDKGIPTMQEYQNYTQRKLNGPEAIEELNERFKQHAVGYLYEVNRIIKVDSLYSHVEIVKPTLQLLFHPVFAGANEEYLKAHEHYRHGRNKESMTECLKAFESTIKIICTKKGWSFSPTATSSVLIGVILTNNLIPSYIQSQLTALRSILESGIPTIRNKVGGHGQGAIAVTADDETTRYALNLTGSNIIYLIELSNL